MKDKTDSNETNKHFHLMIKNESKINSHIAGGLLLD